MEKLISSVVGLVEVGDIRLCILVNLFGFKICFSSLVICNKD